MEDIIEEIERLKRERKAVILAHLYQPEEIQEIADFTGDSFGLSRQAARTAFSFAGVMRPPFSRRRWRSRAAVFWLLTRFHAES